MQEMRLFYFIKFPSATPANIQTEATKLGDPSFSINYLYFARKLVITCVPRLNPTKEIEFVENIHFS